MGRVPLSHHRLKPNDGRTEDEAFSLSKLLCSGSRDALSFVTGKIDLLGLPEQKPPGALQQIFVDLAVALCCCHKTKSAFAATGNHKIKKCVVQRGLGVG